jgi:Ca2+-binding EF-hand superfamily protein
MCSCDTVTQHRRDAQEKCSREHHRLKERELHLQIHRERAVAHGNFMLADKDKSGTLDFEEFMAMPENKGLGRRKLQEIFKAMDLNNDGEVDKQEFALYIVSRRLFGDADYDKSGCLDFDEFCAFARTDNLLLSRSEARTLFDRLDVSKDGVLDAQEFAKYLPKHHADGSRTVENNACESKQGAEGEEVESEEEDEDVESNVAFEETQGQEAELEEQAVHAAMQSLRACLHQSPYHPTAVVGLSQLLMSAAVRIRGRQQQAAPNPSANTHARGVPQPEPDGAAQIAEAQLLLLRLLSSDPWHAPALMAFAQLLWHPLLLNRPLCAEALYRQLLLATNHLGPQAADEEPEQAGHLPNPAPVLPHVKPRTPLGGGALIKSLRALALEERRVVSYNLALLLCNRGVDVGNHASCREAEQVLAAFPAPSRHAGVEFVRGRLWMWRRMPEKAEECFGNVLAVNAQHIDALLHLAAALSGP